MEEENDNVCIAKLFDLKGKKKNKKTNAKKEAETVSADPAIAAVAANNGSGVKTNSGARICLFDFSVENFFRYMDTIARLCGIKEEEPDAATEQSEIQRMSSSVTFLREWSDFKYPSRTIRFTYGLGSSECYEGKDDSSINLPQFSSATVPEHDMQKEEQLGDAKSQESRDFVMNVGGPVWALDWCPRIHEDPDCSIKCEFIAVAAHPPGSSYHKMGASLTGRGAVQIWCLLNVMEHHEEISSPIEKMKKKPKKDGGITDKSTQIKRPRGRPRKNPTVIAVNDTNGETQHMPSLAVQFAENSTEFPAPDGNLENYEEISSLTEKREKRTKKDEGTNEKSTQIKRPRGRPRKNPTAIAVDYTNCETQYMPSLAVQLTENSTEIPASEGNLENNGQIFPIPNKRKINPKKAEAVNEKSALMKRPRGRPKTNTKEVTASDPNCENQFVPLAVQVPEDSSEFISPDGAHGNCNEHASQQYSNTKQNHAKKAASACNSKPLVKRSRLKINHGEERYNQDISQPLLIQCENETSHQLHCSSELEPPAATCSIPGDVTSPRVVSCLAHNGKVAWDVKWRPLNISDSLCKHRMGYLAVLLGNGSLEVWEVPLPHVLREIYTHREGTDPRFIKLEPVFKCSMLKRGGFQSIPLTVEWSVTPPHDYLLAGCHDGTVALWKFSTNSSSKCDDTKPVLCFGGDTVPIRTVAWAPFEGDQESSNIIVTAGHEGLKFWDLRNPFRPLRNLHPAPRIIYSLDWLSKPSCIIMSFEDGTMRTFSLVKAANELPVTGTTYSGKKQPWLHSSSYSSFAIWSVHVSRITGMVAYCGADGTAVRFQLTTKSVETDNSHNRIPYFLCGSVSEEESTLIVNTPVSNTPFPLRKSQEKGRHAQSFRDLLSKANLSKSASNQMAKASNSDSQTLALCDGDNLGLESGSEEALSSEEHPKRPKPNCNSKKKPVQSTALVCTDDVSTNNLQVDNEKSDFGGIPEAFPSKMVALHRVRWNMNKGSEKWLCFGGASGLVRCQEIVFSRIDKKWALKR
ncbi:WD40/YVTN repeat-like-containing domain superfamily [Sesbania bispinosa]|nr:WD40/YVTN repeat-like-containing domain superfamily [Sesbania bispinosa]